MQSGKRREVVEIRGLNKKDNKKLYFYREDEKLRKNHGIGSGRINGDILIAYGY